MKRRVKQSVVDKHLERAPDFAALEAGPRLWLQFPEPPGIGGPVDGTFIRVARARKSVKRIAAKFGMEMVGGLIDGAPADAVITLVRGESETDLIPLAMIPEGRGSTFAVELGADYRAAHRYAALFYDGKLRPIS